MEKAAQGAFDAGKLAGKAPGVFEGVVNAGGVDVTVRGAVVDGISAAESTPRVRSASTSGRGGRLSSCQSIGAGRTSPT